MLKSGGNFSGDARYEGFCIDLLKEIARIVGFAYRIELVPDGKYGVYDYETGEWNGIVRQLMDKVSGWDRRHVCACVRIVDRN
jgi:ionotropic kainate glutamate receptor 2